MMIYVSKNKVKKIKKTPNNNLGIEIIKGVRWTLENDAEFKENYEKMRKDKNYEKERTERSLRRTRKNIQDILHANLDDKSYFLTLTFAENLQDYKKANSKFHYFMRIKNKNIKYLAVKEHQERGAIHYHLIVFDINDNDLKSLQESWTYGFTQSKKITNKYSYSIANYLTKYFTKEKNQLVKAGYRIFTKSNDLNKPLIISAGVVDKILTKYGYNIDLVKYDWLQHDYVIKNKSTHNLAVDIFI
jgi:hypothetical protein